MMNVTTYFLCGLFLLLNYLIIVFVCYGFYLLLPFCYWIWNGGPPRNCRRIWKPFPYVLYFFSSRTYSVVGFPQLRVIGSVQCRYTYVHPLHPVAWETNWSRILYSPPFDNYSDMTIKEIFQIVFLMRGISTMFAVGFRNTYIIRSKFSKGVANALWRTAKIFPSGSPMSVIHDK